MTAKTLTRVRTVPMLLDVTWQVWAALAVGLGLILLTIVVGVIVLFISIYKRMALAFDERDESLTRVIAIAWSAMDPEEAKAYRGVIDALAPWALHQIEQEVGAHEYAMTEVSKQGTQH